MCVKMYLNCYFLKKIKIHLRFFVLLAAEYVDKKYYKSKLIIFLKSIFLEFKGYWWVNVKI